MSTENNEQKCLLLFSGGTDSLCSAALLAEKFSEIHLITYHEKATEDSPVPTENVERLRKHYPQVNFQHHVVSTDKLVQAIGYESFFRNIFRFGFYNLSTPGISSLSWHLSSIIFCKSRNIKYVFDGMTKELMHLPGHHPDIRRLFTELYAEQGISFSSPVIDWKVPPDQRYVDRLIVDPHGFVKSDDLVTDKTTGSYLYEKGILPHPNVKGSLFDQRMQHDCYPFVLFNIFVFWWAHFLYGEEKHNIFLIRFMNHKVNYARKILKEIL